MSMDILKKLVVMQGFLSEILLKLYFAFTLCVYACEIWEALGSLLRAIV